MVVDQALSLLLVSLAAAVLPGVSRLLRLPPAVTEILFGVVLGESFLQLRFSGEWLEFLAHLGFLMLMFQSGMEIDFRIVSKIRAPQFFLHFLVFAGTLGLSMTFASFMGRGMFMALVLATTSLGLVMPTLKEAGVSRTPYGQGILMAASLADFLTLLAITFYVLWGRYGLTWRFVSPLPLLAGFALLLWIGRTWAWWNPGKAERLLDARDSGEMGVRLSMALLFLFVAVSEMVHLEPALGAFLGGCALSFVFREKEGLEHKLSALGFGFLIPIFFIHVGMRFDLNNLLETGKILFTAKLLVLSFVVKLLPSLLFALERLPWRSLLAMGVLLSSRLSLIVAAATIGVQEGFITQVTKDSVVLLALMTCFLGPTLFKAMQGKKK